VEGVDTEACGGTHHMLNSTGEIGYFKIVKREGVQDGIERITYKAGSVAVKYVQDKEALLRNAATILSVGDGDLPRNVERFFNEWKEQRKRIDKLVDAVAKDEAKSMIEECGKTGKPAVRILDLDPDGLKKIGSLILADEHAMAILMTNQGNLVCAAGAKAKLNAKA
jgi:alanyl-tRNA synthetase